MGPVLNKVLVSLGGSQLDLGLALEDSDVLESIDLLGEDSVLLGLGAVGADQVVTLINLIVVGLLVKGMDISLSKNIRLPEELKQVVPLVSGQSPLEQTYKALTGTPIYGKCVLGQGYVHSFDQKTYNYQIDECDHLISSDCSKAQEHSVLAKEVNGLKHI